LVIGNASKEDTKAFDFILTVPNIGFAVLKSKKFWSLLIDPCLFYMSQFIHHKHTILIIMVILERLICIDNDILVYKGIYMLHNLALTQIIIPINLKDSLKHYHITTLGGKTANVAIADAGNSGLWSRNLVCLLAKVMAMATLNLISKIPVSLLRNILSHLLMMLLDIASSILQRSDRGGGIFLMNSFHQMFMHIFILELYIYKACCYFLT
ncbi:hypothetical protein ACJX0J_030521, partial [Zea mays]